MMAIMQLILFILSLLALFTLVSATTDAGDLFYPMPQFNGVLAGHVVSLNGTVQEMMAQMQNLHPEFNAEAFALASLTSRSQVLALNVRQDPRGVICDPVPGQPWGPTDVNTILNGVKYLQSMSTLGLGPGCSRISCQGGSAIWWCNDNRAVINVPGYVLAYYAEFMAFDCVTGSLCGGQGFDTGGWNIIVRADQC